MTHGEAQRGDIRLTVIPDEVVRLAPGNRAVVLLVVEDAGHDAEALPTRYRLEVSGIRRRWYTLGETEVLLGPGARTVVPLALHPILDDESLACYPIRVRVSWPANPSIGAKVVVTLMVVKAEAPPADAPGQDGGVSADHAPWAAPAAAPHAQAVRATRAPPTRRRFNRILAGVGLVTRKAVGVPPDSAETPPLSHIKEETVATVARAEDVAAAPGFGEGPQAPVAETVPPSSSEEGRHMSLDEMAHRGVAGVAAAASAGETAAASAGDWEGTETGRDEQRRLLIAECWSLEQRWAEIRAQVVDLDAEWRHLVSPLKDGEDAAQRMRPLDWADGVLVFRDLSQHAARLSGLTEEALHTCKQYALALQRAMEGLEV